VIDVPPVLARGKPSTTSSGVVAPKPRDEAAAEFAEAEFFIEQGLFDEAREAVAALRRRVASRPELSSRLEALLRRLPRAEPAESSGLVDIGSEIAAEVSASEADAQDEFQYSVQDVLQEFKKGVEKAVRPEDVETHYELGIAYKEMGLTDEAIGEFEVALRGAAGKPKEPDCLAMIGICYSANGAYTKAVGYFERALSSRAIRAETKLNLQYEIGVAREAAGDPRAALEAFEQVARIDASYREVGQALARLRAARGASNGSPPSQLENLVRTEAKAPLVGEPNGSKVRKVGYL
jgi:tetratricopeptide (TPR) repeat protein